MNRQRRRDHEVSQGHPKEERGVRNKGTAPAEDSSLQHSHTRSIAGQDGLGPPEPLRRNWMDIHATLGNQRVQKLAKRAQRRTFQAGREEPFLREAAGQNVPSASLGRQEEAEGESSVLSKIRNGAGSAGAFVAAALESVWDRLSFLEVGKLTAKLLASSVIIAGIPPLLIAGIWVGTYQAVRQTLGVIRDLIENFDAITEAIGQAVKTMVSKGGPEIAGQLGQETGRQFGDKVKELVAMPFKKLVWGVAKLAGEIAAGVILTAVTGGIGGVALLGSRALTAAAGRLPALARILMTVQRLMRQVPINKLARLARSDAGSVAPSATSQFHEIVWRTSGGKGPAPEAFKVGKNVRVDMEKLAKVDPETHGLITRAVRAVDLEPVGVEEVVRIVRTDPHRLANRVRTASGHEFVWKQLGGEGPAPTAFRAEGYVHVNDEALPMSLRKRIVEQEQALKGEPVKSAGGGRPPMVDPNAETLDQPGTPGGKTGGGEKTLEMPPTRKIPIPATLADVKRLMNSDPLQLNLKEGLLHEKVWRDIGGKGPAPAQYWDPTFGKLAVDSSRLDPALRQQVQAAQQSAR